MRLSAALLAFITVLAATICSRAAIITYDNFDYPDGSLIANSDWASHSGTANDVQVTDGQAVVVHGSGSRQDVNLAFDSSAGDIYYGIDFLVDDLGAPYSGADNEYFAHFKDGTTVNFSARLDVVAPTGTGDFTLGIATDDSDADAIWANDLSFDITYRAIVRYDQVNNIAQLWVDASVPTDPSILGDDKAAPGDTIQQFALRQSVSSENETVRVDGLVVGTAFADVVTAIPEPAALAMMGLSVGLLVFLRRRR